MNTGLSVFLEMPVVMDSGPDPSGRPGMTSELQLSYYVYFLASRRHGTLCLDITRDLVRRVHEHKSRVVPGFSAQYQVDRLVWFETYDDPVKAITHEELKKWRRDWKIRLIEEQNPEWRDLHLPMLR
jgi:putative endonuclease